MAIGFLIRDGKELFGEVDATAGDQTALPANVSLIRAEVLAEQKKILAVELSKLEKDVTDEDLVIKMGLVDTRVKL